MSAAGLEGAKTCVEGPVTGGECELVCDAAGYMGNVTFTCDGVSKTWVASEECTPGMVCLFLPF